MPNKVARYGWIPDLPDARDHRWSASRAVLERLPPHVDLTPACPPVYDQGELGSCTANAIAGAIELLQRTKARAETFTPSRLFIYYNERVLEHTVDADAGAMLRDGIKTAHRQGVCPEAQWPYQVDRFAQRPPERCYTEAQEHQGLVYRRVERDLGHLKGCLAAGHPFVFGFAVYASFESAAVEASGTVPMPDPSEPQIGGHAVLAVGYDERQRRFLVRNSWGAGWGCAGYGTLPYDYLLDENLADDFWMLRLAE